MKIHDPKVFGGHITGLRKKAGVSWELIADKMYNECGLHPKHYVAIEMGTSGTNIDDQILDALMDKLPGFSVATSPGVNPPGKPAKEALSGKQ